MSGFIKFPVMDAGTYAVLFAETRTGIVLALDGQYALDNSDRYRVFSSFELAKTFANMNIIEDPRREAVILDCRRNVVLTLRDENEISASVLAETRPERFLTRIIMRIRGLFGK
jgi:hypothetical protein